MKNIYLVTGKNKNMESINVKIVAYDEIDAIKQVQKKYGEGDYVAKLISGRLNG